MILFICLKHFLQSVCIFSRIFFNMVYIQCSLGVLAGVMYCDTAQAKAGNVTYLRSCLSSLGPRANSISDLWWMVWQEGVTQIVMLTNIQEGGKVGSWAYCLCPCFCTVQFCSVQFKMVSMHSGKKHIHSTPSLRGFPNVSEKRFQCSSG